MRGRAAVLSTVVLVAVLGCLMALLLVAISDMSDRTGAVENSVRALSAYQNVQRAIAAEAFAEAGYRRAPGGSSRARVESAIADLGSSASAVRALNSRPDDAVINYLLILNGRYQREIRSSLHEGSNPPATTLDDRIAGPALDAMQGLVDAAVTGRQRLADEALTEQRRLSRELWLLGPAALGVAVLAIGLCWAVILGQQRRLHGRAEAGEHKALHDVLTGVGNRALLSRQLQVELGRRHPDAALVMIDLDDFKLVNDVHGHGAGDEVLRTVAARLRDASGDLDVVCRMGGDEFAVLLRHASDVPAVAAAIQDALREPVLYDGIELRTGGSIGTAVLQCGKDERAVLVEADAALYAVKRAGRMPRPRPAPSAANLL